jgi:hypothetical protein
MSNRSERRERNRNKAQQPQSTNPKKTEKAAWQWLELLSPTGKLAAGLALLLTIAGTYYAFSPKLSIYPTDSLDSTKPFATPFVVKNDSLLPITSIELNCRLQKVILNNKVTMLGSKEGENETTFKSINITPIPTLAPGEESTFFLPFPDLTQTVTFADISAEVSYSPALLPFKKKTLKRFVTMENSNGVLRWVAKSRSE